MRSNISSTSGGLHPRGEVAHPAIDWPAGRDSMHADRQLPDPEKVGTPAFRMHQARRSPTSQAGPDSNPAFEPQEEFPHGRTRPAHPESNAMGVADVLFVAYDGPDAVYREVVVAAVSLPAYASYPRLRAVVARANGPSRSRRE